MYLPVARTRTALALVCLAALVPARAFAQAPQTGQAGSSDLDTFMEKVLARREVNRTTLNQYILDEAETFEILGPGRWPLHRMKRDFTWYARDGMHVRSPLRFNGVSVMRRVGSSTSATGSGGARNARRRTSASRRKTNDR